MHTRRQRAADAIAAAEAATPCASERAHHRLPVAVAVMVRCAWVATEVLLSKVHCTGSLRYPMALRLDDSIPRIFGIGQLGRS